MTTAADRISDNVVLVPTRPSGDAPTLPPWRFSLDIHLPEGYAVHPATVDRVTEGWSGVPVVARSDGRIEVLCAADGISFEDARADAAARAFDLLRALGLSPRHLAHLDVAPLVGTEEALAALERDGRVATISDLAARRQLD